MVQGLAAFRSSWGSVASNVRSELQAEMEAIADKVVAQMRARAPKGESLDLVNSIGWTWGEPPAGSMVLGSAGGVAPGSGERLRITFYAGGPATTKRSKTGYAHDYALYQEFGRKGQPAQPFFYSVWRAMRRSVRSRMTRAINRAVQRALG